MEREQSREEGKYQEPSFPGPGWWRGSRGYLSIPPGSSSGRSQDRSHRRGCSHSAHCSLAQMCHPVDRGESEVIRSSSPELRTLLLEFDGKTEPLPHKDAQRLGPGHSGSTFYNWVSTRPSSPFKEFSGCFNKSMGFGRREVMVPPGFSMVKLRGL